MAAVRSNQHTSRLFRWAGQNANEFANNKLDILRDIDALPTALRALSSDDFVRHIVEFAFGTPTVKTPFIWDIVSDEIVNRDARSLGSDGIGRSLSALAKVNYVNNTAVIKSPYRTVTFGTLVPVGRKVCFLSQRNLGCAQVTFFEKCKLYS